MTDLQMTKTCAEAMGLTHWPHHWLKECIEVSDDGTGRCSYIYNPLTNDEQAMALVKKFRLEITDHEWGPACWQVSYGTTCGVADPDLNRAIVGCVVKMRKRK